MIDYHVTFGGTIKSAFGKPTPIRVLIEMIKADPELIEKTHELRKAEDEEEAKEIKEGLPWMVSGKFTGNYRHIKNFEKTSILIFDVDKLNKKPFKRIWGLLTEWPTTLAAFTSPSGNGIKFMVRVNRLIESPADYANIYNYMMDQYKGSRIPIDKVCRDCARACFLPSDPNVYYNPESEVVDVRMVPLPTEMVAAKSKIKFVGGMSVDDLDDQDFVEAVKFITKFYWGKEIEYEVWRNISFAIAYALFEDGFELFKKFSSNPRYNDSDEFLERFYNRAVKSTDQRLEMNMSNIVTEGTVFQHAYEIGWKKGELIT